MRLDDYQYITTPNITDLFMTNLAKLRFHGVSVSLSSQYQNTGSTTDTLFYRRITGFYPKSV